jgi:hypothetical protein
MNYAGHLVWSDFLTKSIMPGDIALILTNKLSTMVWFKVLARDNI